MKLKLKELKAADLRRLAAQGKDPAAPAVNAKQSSYWAAQRVHVEHKGCAFAVGHWNDWQGDFWMVEEATGMIFRGSLTYIKELIQICTMCQLEDAA
ncbi:hypothetical protein [Pseudomonas sp. B14(2017)]|uniref:hypothetical protein n=1 Tax=Pseudomonas sp. B14(2017) TaxID=1981745 RepID=UPI000A1F1FE4|nr:hypothetical protein [Pseudomonas sp. B14(2017)]